MRRPYAAMKENTEQLSSEEKQYRKMTEEPVCRLIMKLGLPTTISMLITNVYNMVDTWFVSRLGTSATGAVGIVFGLMAIIQAFGFMFGQGAGTNISRALGAHKKERARAFSATGFYLALFAGTAVSVFGILNLDGLCRLLGSTETILPYARIYAFYVLLSAPAMATGCVMNNILRYEGYASLAMVGLVSGGVLNMAGDAFFMFGLHMGVRGAALSTMISQYISFGILLYFLLCGKTQSSLSIRYFTKKASVFGSILASGFPSMVRQGLASVVSRIFMFIFSVALGIGQGFQPVSSFNYGARKYTRLRKAFWFTLFFGLANMVVFTGVVFVFRSKIIMQFLSNQNAYDIAYYALVIQCASQVAVPFSVCANMLFQSIGKAGRATILATFRSGSIYIPVLLILGTLFGLRGIQWTQPVTDILASAISMPIAVVFLHKLPKDGLEEGAN